MPASIHLIISDEKTEIRDARSYMSKNMNINTPKVPCLHHSDLPIKIQKERTGDGT